VIQDDVFYMNNKFQINYSVLGIESTFHFFY